MSEAAKATIRKIKPVPIQCVWMTPTSTRTEPWRFIDAATAAQFSLITYRAIWACFDDVPAFVYRFYPGGRTERWTAGKSGKLCGTEWHS